MPRRRPLILAWPLLAAALAGGSFLAAQPFAEVEDRRRAVGDWLVEHVGEEDGGRLVRMTREGDDHNIEYRIGFWHDNPGPVLGGTVMRFNGMCGGYESPSDGRIAAAAAVRAELAGHLAQCGVSAEAAAATLQGFERAYALVAAWAEEAEAASAAHGQAIADYGNDMITDADMTGVEWVDMNATDASMTDTNYTADPEPEPATDLEATDAGDPD
jgi:hypothetical protein